MTTKRISKKVKAAIDTLVTGKASTITDAAAAVGISREHLSRELSKPHIAAHLRTRSLRNIAVAVARASHTKISLLDSGNDLVRDRASSFILGVAGISPQTTPAAPPSGHAPGLQIVVIAGGQHRVVAEPQPVTTIEHEQHQIERK